MESISGSLGHSRNQVHGSNFRKRRSRFEKDGHHEVLTSYVRLQEQGMKPSIDTVVAALKACSSLRDQQTGRRIHMDVLENGDFLHNFVANSVVNMYAKCGSIGEARLVFESIQHRDVVSWTAMILGYADCGQAELALKLYQRMREEGCAANRVTVLAALKACASLADREEGQMVEGKVMKLRSLERGRLVHSQAQSSGIQLDVFGNNSLMVFYEKCGSMGEAQKVFDGMKLHNVVSWSCLIHGYARTGEGNLAMQLYQRMLEEGCQPDGMTFVAALKACCSLVEQEQGRLMQGKLVKADCLEKCRQIHYQACRSGFHDHFVSNTLVDLYAKCGSMVEAEDVFNSMSYRDLVSWNTIILVHAESGDGQRALQLFSRMKDEGVRADCVTLNAALKACSCLAEKGLDQVKAIHAQAAASNLLQTVVENTLVDAYAKCGSFDDALQVFQRMKQRTVVSWNCIISACSSSTGDARLALELYSRMQEDGFTPNRATVLAALKACGNLAALEVGRKIQAAICSSGMQSDAAVSTRLVDFYGKCGSMKDAEQVLFASSASRKNLVTWTALIEGYGSQGNSQQAFELFERMQKEEFVKPDKVTYLSLLSACRHSGLVEKGREFVMEMSSKHGIDPGVEHYTCMVDLLGRGNRLEEAVAMVRRMPFAGDVVIWLVVLTWCWKWGDVRTGKVAFDAILEIDSKQAAAYVLMANVYAAVGMWDDAVQLQNNKCF